MQRKCEVCGCVFTTQIKINNKRVCNSGRTRCYKCKPYIDKSTRDTIKETATTKVCGYCNVLKDITEFYPTKTNTKRRSYCKECDTKITIARQRDRKAKFVKILGGKCSICGYDKYVGSLEFHHKDPTEKEFQLSKMKTKTAALVELNKCVLVCSNCHKELHHKL